MFTKNTQVSLFCRNSCLEKGPGKSLFENVFVKYTKYGGSDRSTWFQIWSNINTNTNIPYLCLFLQIQIRLWPQPCTGHVWTYGNSAHCILFQKAHRRMPFCLQVARACASGALVQTVNKPSSSTHWGRRRSGGGPPGAELLVASDCGPKRHSCSTLPVDGIGSCHHTCPPHRLPFHGV